jgi:hypothetical protein
MFIFLPGIVRLFGLLKYYCRESSVKKNNDVGPCTIVVAPVGDGTAGSGN